MSISRPIMWFAPLVVLFGFLAKADDDYREKIKKIHANLCATTPEPEDAKTEAGFCLECEIGAVSTTPEKILGEPLTKIERQELDYLSSLTETGVLIVEAQSAFKQLLEDLKYLNQIAKNAKLKLHEAEELVNQLTEAVQVGSGLSPLTLPALQQLTKQEIEVLEPTFHGLEYQIQAISKMKDGADKLGPEALNEIQQKHKRTKSELAHVNEISDQLTKWQPSEKVIGPLLTNLLPIAKKARDQARNRLEFRRADENDAINRKNLLEQNIRMAQENSVLVAKTPAAEQPALLKQLRDKFQKMLAGRPKADGYTDCGLTVGEAWALLDYTKGSYKPINEALRTQKGVKELEPAIALINSGLRKFARYNGTVRRGVNFPDAVLEQHQPGQTVHYKAFSSTSLRNGFDFQPHHLVIHSKRGRFIAPYSSVSPEAEVLFAPAKFRVISREDQPDGKVRIVLEELE